MNDFSKVDKNFIVETKIEKEGIKFYNCLSEPFKIYGVYYEDGKFRRLPEKVAETVSEGVLRLHANTAGGRIRFKTNSPYVAISVIEDENHRWDHFAMTGYAGFDMYDGNVYVRTFRPPNDMIDRYESVLDFPTEGIHDVTINMPLYSNVRELYIGVDENAVIEEADEYINEKPVVYYGSSITQGGCASRPGRCYQAIISRRFNLDYVNLGFSGSGKAEDIMIDYIKNLEMSLFVYDYDFNAPTAEYLESTHEKMFKAIRETHPDMPIIMLTAPKYIRDAKMEARLKVIKKTYDNAVANGDKNVYFIEGKELMKYCGNEGTVDGTHPTDFGFESMSRVLGDLMEGSKLV